MKVAPDSLDKSFCTKTDELRCECHRLLARINGHNLELRCPRCKRKLEIDLDELAKTQSIPLSLHLR